MLDWSTTVVVIAAFAMTVALYGIYIADRARSRKQKIDHDEFKAKLEPAHEEQLARIDASVKSDVAKYTGKPIAAVQQIDQR